MRRYQVYSDASFDENRRLGVASYVILDKRGKVFALDTFTGKHKNSFEAEMAAIVTALQVLPKNSAAQVFSDLRAIREILAKGSKSKHQSVRKVRELEQDKGIELTVEFVRFYRRSPWYEYCHQRSNLMLRAIVGRGGKTLGGRK